MKIHIEEIEDFDETEITIKCQSLTDDIIQFVKEYKLLDTNLLGQLNGESHLLNPDDLYYIETVDNKVFAYTPNEVYEINHKLYTLEKTLPHRYFFRASKSIIINISKITSLKSLLNGRIQATLDNDEKIIISRHHVPLLKEKLGVKKI